MSLLRPMQNELYKFRKRKKISIDGSVAGIPYSRYRRSIRPYSGPFRPGSNYLRNTSQNYTPNINAPAVRQNQYDPEDDFDFFVPRTHEPKLFRPFPEIPQNHDEVFDYDKAKKANEILSEIMQQVYEKGDVLDFVEGTGVPLHKIDSNSDTEMHSDISLDDSIDNMLNNNVNDQNLDNMVPDLGKIAETLWFLENKLPHDHPDIINLKEAMIQLGHRELNETEQSTEFQQAYDSKDDWQSNLGSGDPYKNDNILEFQASFAPSDTEQFDAMQTSEQAAEGNLEQMVQHEQMAYEQADAMAVEFCEPQQDSWAQAFEMNGLDVFDTNPAKDEINHAMQEASQMLQPEPDPWLMPYDPFNQMMQPQYMPDPFGMPGMMGPMPGP